jgi:hypothetical protein
VIQLYEVAAVRESVGSFWSGDGTATAAWENETLHLRGAGVSKRLFTGGLLQSILGLFVYLSNGQQKTQDPRSKTEDNKTDM